MTTHARKEPLVTRASVTATISGLTSLLVTVGVFPATIGKQVDGAAEAVIATVFLVLTTVPVIVHGLQARKDVTPVADPRNDTGEKLVPAGSAQAEPDAVVALAAADAIAPAVAV